MYYVQTMNKHYSQLCLLWSWIKTFAKRVSLKDGIKLTFTN